MKFGKLRRANDDTCKYDELGLSNLHSSQLDLEDATVAKRPRGKWGGEATGAKQRNTGTIRHCLDRLSKARRYRFLLATWLRIAHAGGVRHLIQFVRSRACGVITYREMRCSCDGQRATAAPNEHDKASEQRQEDTRDVGRGKKHTEMSNMYSLKSQMMLNQN